MGFPSYVLVLTTTVFVGTTLAAYSGDYVPKSYYIIDHNGHQSDLVPIRNKRDLLQSFLRMRRSNPTQGYSSATSSAHATAGASASASAGSVSGLGGGYNGGDYHPNLAGSNNGFPQNFGSGIHPTGGYDGPILFSRIGEDTGTGVHVSGQAQGPNAAYASSHSSIDNTGKIKYSVQSGKY